MERFFEEKLREFGISPKPRPCEDGERGTESAAVNRPQRRKAKNKGESRQDNRF